MSATTYNEVSGLNKRVFGSKQNYVKNTAAQADFNDMHALLDEAELAEFTEQLILLLCPEFCISFDEIKSAGD